MSKTILGVDVSAWQGRMNWTKAKDAGAEYAFIRAGSINNITGVCYTDYQLENNRAAHEFMPAGVGYYWYFRGNHDPIKQADFFSNVVRDYSTVPVIDVEEQGGLTPEVLRDRVVEFVTQVNINLGLLCDVYTSAYKWNIHSGGVPPVRMGVAEHWLFPTMKLWIAMYNTTVTHPWQGLHPNYKPRDWDEYTFWQFSADKNGRGAEFGAESPDICLDRFLGTREQLYTYFGQTPDPIPAPEPLEQRMAALERRVARLERLWLPAPVVPGPGERVPD